MWKKLSHCNFVVINVKLCIMVLLTELYPFTSLSVTLNIFKVTAVSVLTEFLRSYPVKLKLSKIVNFIK